MILLRYAVIASLQTTYMSVVYSLTTKYAIRESSLVTLAYTVWRERIIGLKTESMVEKPYSYL